MIRQVVVCVFVCVYIYSMRCIHFRGQENGHQQRNVIEIVECIVGAGQWEGGQMELHKDEFDILAMIKFLSGSEGFAGAEEHRIQYEHR